jgi:hypothetical protein
MTQIKRPIILPISKFTFQNLFEYSKEVTLPKSNMHIKITVPRDWKTTDTNLPRYGKSILRNREIKEAMLIHDLIYQKRGKLGSLLKQRIGIRLLSAPRRISRFEADWIFREIIKEQGMHIMADIAYLIARTSMKRWN